MAVSQKNVGSTKKQKNKPKSQSKFYAVFTLMLAFALSCVVTLTSLTPKRYEVSEGSVAKETITAPRMVENTVMTEALRDAARSGVKTVYAVDTKLADSLISGAQSFFSAVMSFKNAAVEIKASTAPTITGADGNTYPADDDRTWNEIIPTNDLLAMLVKLPVSITDTSLGYVLLETSEADISALQEMVLTTLEEELRAGVTENNQTTILEQIKRELKLSSFSVWLKSLGETVYDAYLQPTNVANAIETTRAQEKAASEVETVYFARGSVLVEAGQTITTEQMNLLLSLDLVKGAEATSHLAPGVISYLFFVYVLMLAYLASFEQETFVSNKKMTILVLILLLTSLLEWVCYLIDPRVTPAVFGVMLASLLLSRHVAEIVNIALAVSLALLAGGSGNTLFGSDSILAMASMLAAGQATILVAERSQKRGALIAAGTVGGVAGAAVVVAGAVILEYALNSALIYAGLVMASSL
ncbi:MAG: hypothetical protein ABFC73_06575, partial [Clostridiaceae bacterium]